MKIPVIKIDDPDDVPAVAPTPPRASLMKRLRQMADHAEATDSDDKLQCLVWARDQVAARLREVGP